ncbi:formimidoylglutamate deiminase [Variovorax sp. PAMC 28711]|uniref:formimidoylglutamate deiminase n=1 Tax=Variovorax sp. PAMC 28711 TaxID=1795631 RepID=UPI00078B1CFB|nr:formimidoylglutamate deiminase [Variovorax sp. PAMC 28711]AMM24632.1 formimidoylglutamate deiminase [Variovorax sp. PAMC 28711]
MTLRSLFAADALLPNGWAKNVALAWDGAGRLVQLEVGAAPAAGAPTAAGPLIPGMPNLHSHAFQRAIAGLTEYRGEAQDSFWSWRTLMYRFASRLGPEQLEAIALGLYVEMLEAGYTSVCEFHYVHHDADGRPYADDATLALALMRAARHAGIGLTLLPVLYQTSGFGGLPPNDGQRRFIRSTDSMLRLLERLKPLCDAQGARLGLAPHSLRAVPPDGLREALAGLHAMDPTAPVHVHIAEQTKEVDDCVAWSGQRPVAWLLDHAPVDARWCLVHATHLDAGEYRRAAASGAVAGLCPTTEANLGDGIFDLPAWRVAGGAWGIGSDSHVCVNAAEELLMLEYSQRLGTRQRNVAADADRPHVATAMTLAAVQGGAQAAGRAIGGLAVGQQADFVVLDATHTALAGLPAHDMLSSHVFASHRTSAIDAVWVAGQPRTAAGRHLFHDSAAAGFVAARRQLLDTP